MLEQGAAIHRLDDMKHGDGLPCRVAHHVAAPHHFTVVTLDRSSMLQLGWVADILAEANRATDAVRFSWEIVSFGNYLEARRVGRHHFGSAAQSRSAVFLSGDSLELRLNDIERERLRQSLGQHSLALACGPAVELFVACSALADGKAAACRTTRVWLREKYPDTCFLEAPLHWSGRIGTSAGGATIAAAMLECLSRLGHSDLAADLGGTLLIPAFQRERPGLSPRARFGARSPKIARAIAFMEVNLEDELSIETVAAHVGSSVRQLERLFSTQMETTPARFLKRLRLDRARDLLVNTELSILQVGCAAGFESPTHFAKCFRRQFAMSPAGWRKCRQPHGGAAASGKSLKARGAECQSAGTPPSHHLHSTAYVPVREPGPSRES